MLVGVTTMRGSLTKRCSDESAGHVRSPIAKRCAWSAYNASSMLSKCGRTRVATQIPTRAIAATSHTCSERGGRSGARTLTGGGASPSGSSRNTLQPSSGGTSAATRSSRRTAPLETAVRPTASAMDAAASRPYASMARLRSASASGGADPVRRASRQRITSPATATATPIRASTRFSTSSKRSCSEYRKTTRIPTPGAIRARPAPGVIRAVRLPSARP